MTFKEYRQRNDLKQTELVAMMNEYGIEITQPILSFIENGKLEATPEMSAWLAGMAEDIDGDYTIPEEMILKALEHGGTYTRTDLRIITGESDRANRITIGKLRDKGHLIIEDKNGGYRIAESKEEFLTWSAKYTAYARTILKRDTAMRRAATLL